ncbi:hypothetical protein AN403_5876 [Pseudomonas fluorescens]|uniref:Uncharacterized protein n=1 Tax=Pseudomonas fluorescens TaxID=294 RepID=A0A0P8X6M0_PSEFL|nr:hypothetical protein AN403_5876 [Pseudomonas fluorescens]
MFTRENEQTNSISLALERQVWECVRRIQKTVGAGLPAMAISRTLSPASRLLRKALRGNYAWVVIRPWLSAKFESSAICGMLLMFSIARGSYWLVLTNPCRVQAGTSSTSPLLTSTPSASPRVNTPLPHWITNRCHQEWA